MLCRSVLAPLALLATFLILTASASAATRNCAPTRLEKEQNGVGSITTKHHLQDG
jgi:hypothetical protein